MIEFGVNVQWGDDIKSQWKIDLSRITNSKTTVLSCQHVYTSYNAATSGINQLSECKRKKKKEENANSCVHCV
jgi:hypothetical protein